MSDRRQHLVETASRLFNADGFHAVGIDRVLAESGVAKTTLYRHFPSKDDLIVACLEQVECGNRELLRIAWERAQADPEAAVRQLFQSLASKAAQDGFPGCAFQLAVGEYSDPAHPIHRCATEAKQRFRSGLRDLAARHGCTAPDEAAEDLFVIAEGLLAVGSYAMNAPLQGSVERLVSSALHQR